MTDRQVPMTKPYTKDPAPLHKFIYYLEEQGSVKVNLLFHSVERKPDSPGRFTVTPLETAVIEVKAEEARTVSG